MPICNYCEKEFTYRRSTRNKFCSNKCCSDYNFTVKAILKVEEGTAGPEICKRYLRNKFGDKCFLCGQLPLWNGKKLVLQLDHKDGDSDNNKPDNLQLLCPNCHTQTETFGNAGKGSRYKKVSKRNKWLQEYKTPVV